MRSPDKAASDFDELGETFLGMLMADVIAADARFKALGDQSSRRDFIRTSFAAIEGLVWTYRENVLSAAATLDELTLDLEFVFSEKSYAVTESGKLVSQPRYISLMAMVRLTTNLAKSLSSDVIAYFGGEGWESLKKAVKIRNRLTHPKSKADLIIDARDIDVCWTALLWLGEFTTDVAEVTLRRQTSHLRFLRAFVADLKSGHPLALQLYEEAKARG